RIADRRRRPRDAGFLDSQSAPPRMARPADHRRRLSGMELLPGRPRAAGKGRLWDSAAVRDHVESRPRRARFGEHSVPRAVASDRQSRSLPLAALILLRPVLTDEWPLARP